LGGDMEGKLNAMCSYFEKRGVKKRASQRRSNHRQFRGVEV